MSRCTRIRDTIISDYGPIIAQKIDAEMKLKHRVSFDTAPDEFADVIYHILQRILHNKSKESESESIVVAQYDGHYHHSKDIKPLIVTDDDDIHSEILFGIMECMGDSECVAILDCISQKYKTVYDISNELIGIVSRSNIYRKIEKLESIGLIHRQSVIYNKTYSYVTTFQSVRIFHDLSKNNNDNDTKDKDYKKKNNSNYENKNNNIYKNNNYTNTKNLHHKVVIIPKDEKFQKTLESIIYKKLA